MAPPSNKDFIDFPTALISFDPPDAVESIDYPTPSTNEPPPSDWILPISSITSEFEQSHHVQEISLGRWYQVGLKI